MNEKRDIEIKIRLSLSEKEKLEDKAKDIPLAVYVRDSALGGFAGESAVVQEVSDWLPSIKERYGSVDAFVEKIMLKVGINTPLKLFRWADGQEKEHPFAGYLIVDISSAGVTVSKEGKHVVISEELGNGGMLAWFFGGNDEPLYAVGDIVGMTATIPSDTMYGQK